MEEEKIVKVVEKKVVSRDKNHAELDSSCFTFAEDDLLDSKIITPAAANSPQKSPEKALQQKQGV